MNIVEDGLGLPWIVGGWLLLLIALGWAVKTAPWHKVQSDKGAQHVLLGVAVIVFFVWQFGASLGNGITFHFLLVTMMTLMFGGQFAIMAMLLALIGVTFHAQLGWLALGLNAVLMGLVPIAITLGLLKVADKFLAPNFFVYVFFNAFLAAAMGVVATLALGAWVMWAAEVQSFEALKQTFIPFIPLMSTPEGFINGMIMAALIVLKPQWISTFYDDKHLKK